MRTGPAVSPPAGEFSGSRSLPSLPVPETPPEAGGDSRLPAELAEAVRVLYGGSVSAENIGEFMIMPEIDGALVGGASLTSGFARLVERAAVRAESERD